MAVTNVAHDRLPWSANFSADGTRTYTVGITITVDNENDGPDTILKSPLGPHIGYPYKGFGYDNVDKARCTDISIQRDKDAWNIWRGVVTYKQQPGQPDDWNINPLLEPTKYSYPGGETIAKPLSKDLNGDACKNSAGQQLNPLPTREFYLSRVVAVHNFAAYDDAGYDQFRGTYNTDPFLGRDPKKVLLKNVTTGGLEIRNDYEYYPVTHEFLVITNDDDDDNWENEIYVDVGTAELVNGNLVPILDARGQPITEPVQLDGAGRKATAGAAPVNLEFKSRKGKAFSALNL